MNEEIDWASKWREADRYHEQRRESLAKRRGVEGEFFSATLAAYQSSKEEELVPTRNTEGNYVWTLRQGVKAACYAREDGAATLILQMALLKRFERLRRLAWLGILLLAYIAYRLT